MTPSRLLLRIVPQHQGLLISRGASAIRTMSSTAHGSSGSSSSYTSALPPPTDALGRASTSNNTELTGAYRSPYADIFERMQANGPTTLGTTQEIVDYYANLTEKKLACGIPESALRFTTTSYGRTSVAPFVHPNEHRVVLKVNTKYLPFDNPSNEMEILREVVGNRLNDERKELRLMSNQFGSRIENKRHLVSMLDRIILSCQRLGRELTSGEPKDGSVKVANEASD